jgi:catechol 2,3-dioxygenase-like lactoylglutathione lyase family enzyme
MANERTYPCLPCGNLDESIAFYQALGFKRTYRQIRPNPYAVVALEDIHIHLFGIEGFQAAESYGSVIVVVPDPQSLYDAFAARLHETFGKLPIVGIPRILRPRKKFGTVQGFSVIDPGGNWLRISKLGDTESEGKAEGLAGIINVAARLGDAHRDAVIALKTLENGLIRFADAAAIDRVRAYLYQAELAVRIQNRELAQSSLHAVQSLELTDDERAAIAEDFAHVVELVHQAQASNG